MKRLSAKVLTAIVACSATLLLSGLNVHAAAGRPASQTGAARLNPDRRSKADSLRQRTVMPKRTVGHYYRYQNLRTVKAGQNAAVRLGARHGKRANRARKSAARKPARRTNKRNRRPARRHVAKHRGKRTSRRRNHKARSRKSKARSKKSVRKPRHRTAKYPRVVNPRERVINQKRSAVNRFKPSLKYVQNDKNSNFNGPNSYGDSDYDRTGQPISSDNLTNVVFHRLTYLPKTMGNNQFYSPQGMVIAGRYAYVITNATNSYENDTDSDDDVDTRNDHVSSSPYRLGASQILRVDLSRHVKDYNNNAKAARRNIKVGPVFYGGHGQGLAYNPRNGQIWLLNNLEGQVTKTAVSEINPRTLLPERKIRFHFGDTTIGDDLTFDRRGQALNVTEAGNDSFAEPGSVKVFRGRINPSGIRMNLVKQGLRWAPTQTIQGLAYNPHNDRMYILGDDSIVSLPVAKLGHLSSNDVQLTTFDSTREFEGLSFDRRGNAYLLVSRSPEILESPEFR